MCNIRQLGFVHGSRRSKRPRCRILYICYVVTTTDLFFAGLWFRHENCMATDCVRLCRHKFRVNFTYFYRKASGLISYSQHLTSCFEAMQRLCVWKFSSCARELFHPFAFLLFAHTQAHFSQIYLTEDRYPRFCRQIR